MQELFQSGDGFVNDSLWEQKINEIKESISGLDSSSKEELKAALIAAVKSRIPSTKFGLMLSGGVDSSFLALLLKKAGADFICYTVGIEGANDLSWAPRVAAALGVEHKQEVLAIKDIHFLMKDLASMYGDQLADENQAVVFGVACVELACINLAAKDGVTHFFGGLGSEEIFAGYKRHEDVDASMINSECWRGLLGMFKRDLVRDILLAVNTGISVSTPYLDVEVVKSAMRIDGSLKIKDGVKKVVLREIAEELGLDREFAWRKKQAAQYGSKFDKAIEKLAKLHGFENKHEYLTSL